MSFAMNLSINLSSNPSSNLSSNPAIKKRPLGPLSDQSRLRIGALKGMEEQVGEETVEFDQNAGGDAKPDGCEHRSSGQEFFHDWGAETVKKAGAA